MVMMGLSSVGMDKHAPRTHHDQRRVNQHCTSGDRNTMGSPTEAFHEFFTPTSPTAVFQLTLRDLFYTNHHALSTDGCSHMLQF